MGIELKNITKKYGNTVALDDVSLYINEGEFITLLGPSGCGKTTLLRIVAGFVEPDSGEVLLNDKIITNIPPNQRPTGMVFQSYALFPHMTVEDNISFGLRMHRMPKPDMQKTVKEVVELVGIQGLEKRFPNQLSGGQQQRVAIARTLALKPAVLLLDEPLAALDRKLRVGMRAELRKLVLHVGITTIFVTHDQEEALTMSDRIAVMDKSRIVQLGTPIEVYDKPRSTFVASFIGNSNLFKGKIYSNADRILSFSSEGIDLPLPDTFSDKLNSTATLLLRPEHIKLMSISGEPQSPYEVLGTIRFVTLLGMSTEYEVQLETGAILRVESKRNRDETPFEVGTSVRITPIDEDSYLFIPG